MNGIKLFGFLAVYARFVRQRAKRGERGGQKKCHRLRAFWETTGEKSRRGATKKSFVAGVSGVRARFVRQPAKRGKGSARNPGDVAVESLAFRAFTRVRWDNGRKEARGGGNGRRKMGEWAGVRSETVSTILAMPNCVLSMNGLGWLVC